MSHIFVVVSVDWEGNNLLEENLQAMKSFRECHPDVPMQQFLNAAYYTREGVDVAATTKKIKDVLLPTDEHGLHLHAWHSLFERSGVTPRNEPRFFSATEDMRNKRAHIDRKSSWQDGGYEVPIDRFEVAELTKVIETSNRILVEQGFDRPKSFRAGGWMAGKNVLDALTESGFVLDASPSNVEFVKEAFGDLPIAGWLMELWPDIDERSQPYQAPTAGGDIWLVPNNGSLANYTTAEDIEKVFKQNLELWQQNPEQDVFVSIGFHQESAQRYLDRLDDGVRAIKALAEAGNLPVTFIADPMPYLTSCR